MLLGHKIDAGKRYLPYRQLRKEYSFDAANRMKLSAV